jgi:hypothetical protein
MKKSKFRKESKYVAKLTRVMDAAEVRYHQGHHYGKSTNRLNELHQDECPRVKELATIIDAFTNTLASGKNCMTRRCLVKIAYDILRLQDKATVNTRKNMRIDLQPDDFELGDENEQD